MPLKGEAKTEYQARYMRRRRARLKVHHVTPLEQRIFVLAAHGLSQDEIVKALRLPPGAVQSTLDHLADVMTQQTLSHEDAMRKAGSLDQAQAMHKMPAYAFRPLVI